MPAAGGRIRKERMHPGAASPDQLALGVHHAEESVGARDSVLEAGGENATLKSRHSGRCERHRWAHGESGGPGAVT